jgi:hypothetical protein
MISILGLTLSGTFAGPLWQFKVMRVCVMSCHFVFGSPIFPLSLSVTQTTTRDQTTYNSTPVVSRLSMWDDSWIVKAKL